jgi:hypothetical protein
VKQLELEKENFEKEEILREKRKLEAEQIAKEDAERKKVTITLDISFIKKIKRNELPEIYF